MKAPGLTTRLKPNAEIKLRGTDYVVRNVGFYPVRLNIFVDPATRPLTKNQA